MLVFLSPETLPKFRLGRGRKLFTENKENLIYVHMLFPSTKLRRVFRKFSCRGKSPLRCGEAFKTMARHFVHADNATNFSKSQFVIMVMWGSRLGRCQDDCAVSRLHSNLIMQRCRLWSDIYWKFVFASRFCYS